jgi:hypothetical protein
MCAQVHVQNFGWLVNQCGLAGTGFTVGTIGQSLRMEAIIITV